MRKDGCTLLHYFFDIRLFVLNKYTLIFEINLRFLNARAVSSKSMMRSAIEIKNKGKLMKNLVFIFVLISVSVNAAIHGVSGGLVVCLGADALENVSRDWATEGYIFQCLETDMGKVSSLRKKVREAGCYGTVTVEQFDGKSLPYINNLVNLIVGAGVPQSEINRVLAPNGVHVKDGKSVSKPWPKEIDEWTHWLYGPENNAVSKDTQVGISRNLQWIMPPSWGRHHNLVPSMSIMVTAGGRIYYIIDEAPIAVKGASDNWALVCRDAFNGLELWKKPIKEWGWKAWQSDMEFNGAMRFKRPDQTFRRIVAIGDKLYATLGFFAPVVEIDGATGKVLRTFAGTENTSAILIKKNMMFLTRNVGKPTPGKDILAIDLGTGKKLWERKGFTGITSRGDPIKIFTDTYLTIGDKNVFFLDKDDVVALDKKTGKEAWKHQRPAAEKGIFGQNNFEFLNFCSLTYQAGTLVLGQLHPSAQNLNGWQQKNMEVLAINTSTGKKIWQHTGMSLAHFSPPDLFINNGMVWTMNDDVSLVGLDLKTGKQNIEHPVKDMLIGHHHRCYRNKATKNFYLAGEEGIEYIDFKTGELDVHHWLRGACAFGILPANGYIYLPTHACGCSANSKLHGFIALASEEGPALNPPKVRLEKGPAFTHVSTVASQQVSPSSWPMHKHDTKRSNHTASEIAPKVKKKWSAQVGGALTQPVVVGGNLFVASKDRNEICCLDAETGKGKWRFTCDGRIDSSPTWNNGSLLFGTQSGSVYCLDATSGKLAWRFRAAPDARMLTSYDRLESPWPVSGSILVRKNKIYCVAGRSMNLNSGMVAYVLDAKTGQMLQQTRLEADTEHKGENEGVVLADILVEGKDSIQMRNMRFNPDDITDFEIAKEKNILISADGGLLDPTWFNSSFWQYGPVQAQMLVFDGQDAYGMMAQKKLTWKSFAHDIFTAGNGYQLFAASLDPSKSNSEAETGTKGKKGKTKKKGSKKKKTTVAKLWETTVSVRAQSLVLTSKHICLAGAPDIAEPSDPWGAFENRKGGMLMVVSKTDGKVASEHKLLSAPVYDGMSAAEDRLYISMEDGSVCCFE